MLHQNTAWCTNTKVSCSENATLSPSIWQAFRQFWDIFYCLAAMSSPSLCQKWECGSKSILWTRDIFVQRTNEVPESNRELYCQICPTKIYSFKDKSHFNQSSNRIKYKGRVLWRGGVSKPYFLSFFWPLPFVMFGPHVICEWITGDLILVKSKDCSCKKVKEGY